MTLPNPTAAAPMDPVEADARRYVRRLRKFYELCAIAVLVIGLCAVVNVVTSPNRLWVLWVVFGFAVAIAFSALETFGRGRWLGREWEERRVRALLGSKGAEGSGER